MKCKIKHDLIHLRELLQQQFVNVLHYTTKTLLQKEMQIEKNKGK